MKTGLLTILIATMLMVSSASAAMIQWTAAEGGNDHWYELVTVDEDITWTDALAASIAAGGNLASIASLGENNFVAELLSSSDWIYNNSNGIFGPWIGASYTDSAWTWSDGTAWSYTAWETGQPNNIGGSQAYVHYYITGYSTITAALAAGQPYTWNDLAYDGTYMRSYVIEYDAQVSAVPEPSTFLLLAVGVAGLVGLGRKRITAS